MQLEFQLVRDTGTRPLTFDCQNLLIAGWAGRDDTAVHHIDELAALGVPRPGRTPLYYRVAASLLTQAPYRSSLRA